MRIKPHQLILNAKKEIVFRSRFKTRKHRGYQAGAFGKSKLQKISTDGGFATSEATSL